MSALFVTFIELGAALAIGWLLGQALRIGRRDDLVNQLLDALHRATNPSSDSGPSEPAPESLLPATTPEPGPTAGTPERPAPLKAVS